MANSRKSTRRNSANSLPEAFKRALEDILARVFVSSHVGPRKIAIAYSGGLDSSILLKLCSDYAQVSELSLHAFHVHHGLSANADAWAEHCRQIAQQRKIIYDMASVCIDPADPRGVEEAARIARYGALKRLCTVHHVPLLLMGHHQDDQAETVLVQLARGAGIAGLAGMAALQKDHLLLGRSLFLGRPLLHVSRRQLANSAVAMALPHIEDESNADDHYRRNAVRLHSLPCMEAVFPECGATIARSAGHMQSAAALLDDLAGIDLATCLAADGHRLQLEQMRKLSEQRLINLLRYWIRLQYASSLSAAQLAELCDQMFNAADDAKPVLDAGSIRLWRFQSHLFARRKPAAIDMSPIALCWNGEESIDIPSWNGRLYFRRNGSLGLPESAMHNADIQVLPRSGGERMQVALNRPSKSLKVLFQENGIAPWQRERLPLIYINGLLVFAAGIGMDVRHANTEKGISLHWDDDPVDIDA